MMEFRPIGDALRCILLNTPRSPNLAVGGDEFAPRPLPLTIALLKESLSPGKDRCTLAWWDGLQLKALASARMRAGSRAWEVGRLYLPEQEGEKELSGLLEGLTEYAASQGAERVLLRLPCDSPMAHNIVKRTGFFPYFEESLLQGNGNGGGQRQANGLGLRPRVPHEEYALFQLYSASTPSSVRSGLGMTFDQWRDSRDRRGRQGRDEVYERDGRIRAWLSSDPYNRTAARMELMVHPDDEDALPALLDYALARKGVQAWLVPEYQEFLRRSLIHRGFGEVARYSVLVKTLVVRVNRPSPTPVEARVW